MSTYTEVPAGLPPPGIDPTFDDKSNIWGSIIALSTVTLVLVILSVCLRLFERIYISKRMNSEDCKHRSF
jgi:hypothetical protein